MNRFSKGCYSGIYFFLFSLMVFGHASSGRSQVNAKFDFNKMADMSDFDPNNPVIPTGILSKLPCWPVFRPGDRDRTSLLALRSLGSTVITKEAA